MTFTSSALRVCALGLAALVVSASQAEVLAFEITAKQGDMTASWSVTLPGDGGIQYEGGEISLVDPDSGTELGRLESLSILAGDEGATRGLPPKVVDMSFSVKAGTSNTSFSMNSALLDGFVRPNAQALANASYTVTDDDGVNGATLSEPGNDGFGATFQSFYGVSAGPTTNVFADLLPSLSALPGDDSAVTSVGTGGFAGNLGTVTSMQTRVAFDLSANDLASGTTVFALIPEPASLVLLAVGAVAVFRRR